MAKTSTSPVDDGAFAPPAGLGVEGAALWRRLQVAYEIENEGGLVLLTRICESRDLVVAAMADVRRDGFVITDRYGAKRGHPLLTVARDAPVKSPSRTTFHDLRHEGGSRLLEAGWPLHHVRDMLGHADISTTLPERRASGATGIDASVRRSRRGCKKVAKRCATKRGVAIQNEDETQR